MRLRQPTLTVVIILILVGGIGLWLNAVEGPSDRALLDQRRVAGAAGNATFPGSSDQSTLVDVRAEARGLERVLGERGETSEDPDEASAAGRSRRFGGHVVTTAGSVVEGAQVFVFDRAPFPGEPPDRVVPLRATVDLRGAFAVSLPLTWRGATVFVTVWSGDKQLGMSTHPVSMDATVLVPDPNQPPGIWVSVEWTSQRPKNAAIMLQSADRTSQFAEAVWDCAESKVFLQFRAPEWDLDVPATLFVGDLPDPSNPRLAMLKAVRLSGWKDLEKLAVSGVAVDCTECRVLVPERMKAVPEQVGLWTKYDAREARVLPVEHGHVTQLLSRELDYSAVGICQGGATHFGYVSRGAIDQIVWMHTLDFGLTQEVVVQDKRGVPVPGALARFVLRDDDPRGNRLHRKAGRADGEGRIVATGFCRGDYVLTVEPVELGDWRSVTMRVEIPGDVVRIDLPDAFVARIVPVGLPMGLTTNDMRGWMKPPGSGWRECTDREWRFMKNGVLGFDRAGHHELMVRLPPFIGCSTYEVTRPNELVDIEIDMIAESSVSGRLSRPDGRPLAGRWISVSRDLSGSQPDGPQWSMSRTGSGGEYQLVMVPGNSGELCVWDSECKRVVARVPPVSGAFLIDSDG